MAVHEVVFPEIKAHQLAVKLVNPGKSAFAGEAVVADGGIEQALTAQFGILRLRLFSLTVGIR